MSRAPPCKCRELDRVQLRDYRLVDRSCRPTGGGRSGVGNFVSERKRSSGSPLHQRSHSCTIRHASVAQVVEPLPSKQRTRVQFPPPAPPMPRSSKWPRTPVLQIGKRGSNPARGTTNLPLRLAGRAPGFDLGRLGSNPRGAATSHQARNSSVGRAGVSYAPSAAGSNPASATIIRRLSQVGRQRVVAPS